jgi:hypothetical protein
MEAIVYFSKHEIFKDINAAMSLPGARPSRPQQRPRYNRYPPKYSALPLGFILSGI